MSSLYLRDNIWWGKSLERKVVRWSLKTGSRAEARRRLKLYDSQSHQEPISTWLKSPVTWEEAAGQLLDYYQAFGTRRPHEAARVLHILDRFFGGWKLTEIDAPAILRQDAARKMADKTRTKEGTNLLQASHEPLGL